MISQWLPILSCVGFLTVCESARSQETDFTLQLLPGATPVAPFVADPVAHRFGLEQFFGKREMRARFGAVVPLARLTWKDLPIHLSVGTSVHTTLDPRESIGVMTNEYAVDFFLLDFLVHPGTAVRFGMGHASHHLGDNGLASSNPPRPRDYSRDHAQATIVQQWPTAGFRAYAGISYAYIFIIDRETGKPWLFQAGGDVRLATLGDVVKIEAAFDVKFRQESDFGTSQRYQLGAVFGSAGKRLIRFFYAFSAGLDDRGQFTGQRANDHRLGIAVEL